MLAAGARSPPETSPGFYLRGTDVRFRGVDHGGTTSISASANHVLCKSRGVQRTAPTQAV